MRLIRAIPVVIAVALAATPARAQGSGNDQTRSLNLTFHEDGRVTLAAKNVSVRDILSEWAQQCRCYVVNAEKLPGTALPYPLLYERQPQARVLESLLRQTAGYVLTPQRPGTVSRSSFETIYILAASTAVASSSFVPPPVPSTPYPMPTQGAPDDELPPIVPMAFPTPGAPRTSGAVPGSDPRPSSQAPPPAPTPRPGGTASTFVSIVPVGSAPSTSPAPGSATTPGQPVPTAPPAPSGPPVPVPGR